MYTGVPPCLPPRSRARTLRASPKSVMIARRRPFSSGSVTITLLDLKSWSSHSRTVRCMQSLRHLACKTHHLFQRNAAQVFDMIRQGDAVEQFHAEEGGWLRGPWVVNEIKNAAYVGMSDFARELDLLLELLNHSRVCRDGRQNSFDGDMLAQFQVPSASYTSPIPPLEIKRRIRKRFASKLPGAKEGRAADLLVVAGELVSSTDCRCGGRDSSKVESDGFGPACDGSLESRSVIPSRANGHALSHNQA